jgi:hypothetical protein
MAAPTLSSAVPALGPPPRRRRHQLLLEALLPEDVIRELERDKDLAKLRERHKARSAAESEFLGGSPRADVKCLCV